MPASLNDDSALRSPDIFCNEAALSDNSSGLEFEFLGDREDDESSVDNMFRMELEQMQGLDVDETLPRGDGFESARRNAVRWMLQVNTSLNFAVNGSVLGTEMTRIGCCRCIATTISEAKLDIWH